MSDESSSLDPAELAMLRRAKGDIARLVASPKITSALDSIAELNTQAAKIAAVNAERDHAFDYVLRNYKSRDQMALEAQWELSKRLDVAIDVLEALVPIEKDQAQRLTSLDAASRVQGRWTPAVFVTAFVAMCASVAAVVVPLFT